MNNTTILQFIQQDLAKSGLPLESFPVTPLSSEIELMDRLGFKFIGEKRIMDIGGYWIPFPNVPGYYRLKLRSKIGDAKYLSPKNGSNHAYIPEGVERLLKEYTPGLEIGLVEGEKKAQAATDAGIPTIGLTGVWNLNDSENNFLPELEQYNWKDKRIIIAFDSDMTSKPQVKHAELRAAVKFTNHGAKVVSTRLPNEPDGSKNGADDFIVRHGKVKYLELNKEARPTLELLISENMDRDQFIKEIARLDSIIEKERIIKLLSSHIKVPVNIIRAEAQKHIGKTIEEDLQGEAYTDEERQKAKELLESPGILERQLETTKKAGYEGEETNQQILSLSFTSRLMDESASDIVKGPSASGKSTLTNTMLRFIPKKDVHSYSLLTPKALVHSKYDLSHSILAVQEHHGAEAADYSIRTTISEQEISILIPIKNEKTGDYKAVEKRIPAVGMVYVETTTQERIHNENQTRMFDLYMNESEDMNRRVIKAMSKAAENPRDAQAIEGEFRIWRCAQSLLKPYQVRIPFATKLDGAFPTEKIRIRRDYPRFLTLIKTHALLYQYQRQVDEKGYLVATLDDLKGVLPLAAKVLTQTLKEITPKQEFVLAVIQHEFKPEEPFHIKDLERKIKDIQQSGKEEIQCEQCEMKCKEENAHLKLNGNGDLDDKNAESANVHCIYKNMYRAEISYRTLCSYANGFYKNGILEDNGEKHSARKFWYISSDFTFAHYTIFSPKFLQNLEKECANPEMHIDSHCSHSTSNGANKEPEAAKEGNDSIKTVVIDGQLVKLEYDERAKTITVNKNGKPPYVCWDPEPEFQEYLRHFEGGL